MESACLKTSALVREFVQAGNATFTLLSTKTEQRFTYRVRLPENGNGTLFFVSLLTGSDNENSYSYIGTLRAGPNGYRFEHGRKSKIAANALGVTAFAWFVGMVFQNQTIPASLEVWHEGRCGRCNRKLTVPSSIERGIGPDCAEMMMMCEAA